MAAASSFRNLEAEQGFAHRALPHGLRPRPCAPTARSTPAPNKYKEMIFKKGQAAGTRRSRRLSPPWSSNPDRIILDLNGGPYAKHRFLSHVSFNDNPVVQQPADQPTGARVTLLFEGHVPETSPRPRSRPCLIPVIDFGVKSSEQAYADTLPPLLRGRHRSSHEVLVGMNHRMVLAALGAPETARSASTKAATPTALAL